MNEKRKTKKINVNEKIEKLILRAYCFYLQGLEDLEKAKPDRILQRYIDEKYLRKASAMFYLVFKILLKIISIELYDESNRFKYYSNIENFVKKAYKKKPEIFKKSADKLFGDIQDFYVQFHIIGYYEGIVKVSYYEQVVKSLEEYIFFVSENVVGISRRQLKEQEYYLKQKKVQ